MKQTTDAGSLVLRIEICTFMELCNELGLDPEELLTDETALKAFVESEYVQRYSA